MIPKISHITSLKSLDQFSRIDNNWFVAITDLKGSTKLISEGKYKQVNMISASCIIAVLNNTKSKNIPYVFGGDGATFLIPAKELQTAKEALLGTQKMANEIFGFELRVGIVPVSDILINKKNIYVSKVKTNKNLYQYVIIGGGLTYAESLIKNPENAEKYLCKFKNVVYKADFSGLSCRWQDIPSHKDETVSLLISVLDPTDITIYQQVLEFIKGLHGSIEELIPVLENNMFISNDSHIIEKQINIANFNKAEALQKINSALLRTKIQFFKTVSKLQLGIGFLSPSSILKRQIKNAADFIKIDDVLRMVISIDKENRTKLEEYLENMFKQKKLVYGIHISDRAHMTCIVLNRYYEHIHFIDGADGGYTLASVGFKQRFKSV